MCSAYRAERTSLANGEHHARSAPIVLWNRTHRSRRDGPQTWGLGKKMQKRRSALASCTQVLQGAERR